MEGTTMSNAPQGPIEGSHLEVETEATPDIGQVDPVLDATTNDAVVEVVVDPPEGGVA